MTQPDLRHFEQPASTSSGLSAWRLASRPVASSIIVLVIGVAATLAAAYLQYRVQRSEASEEFSAWCEERQQRLSRVIDSHVEVLYGMRSLFDASEFVSWGEFERYATEASERHIHIRSLGYLQHVLDADRKDFESLYAQVLGRPFAIVDPAPGGQWVRAPSRPEYVALVYVQGRERLPPGIDALANPQMPHVIAALRHGREASAVIANMPVDASGRTGNYVHVYLPVYPHRGSASEGSEIAEGYVRVRFVLEEMLAATVGEARAAGIEEKVDVSFGDATPLAPKPDGARRGDELVWTESIPLADRNLWLQLRATDAYAGHARFLSNWPLLGAGLALTLLGALGAFKLASSRLRTQELNESLLVQMRERQLSEQRTAESEARYRVLVENSPDAIFLYRQRRVAFVNAAAVRLLRARSADDLLGREILELVDPEYHAIANHRIERMTREQALLPPLEERLIRLDGSTVEVEVRTVPFVVDGDQMLQVMARDITERREAERERASLEAALRQSQRLEAVGTLTGGIAHDFNNILSSIIGNIQLVLDDLPRPHPVRQSAHEIRNATNRARDLVKRLMAFSREQEAPQTMVELAPLIEEVKQLLRPALPAGVMLQSNVPAGAPPVIANASQLHQVLVNLCTNAWQAMPSGQGQIDVVVTTLTGEETREQSKVSSLTAHRYVRIEVRDTGSGIDPQVVDRIFEPFFTTRRDGGGSGLGLAVVHGIVQSHKGAIRVSSRIGAGTSFFIYLPAGEAPARTETASDAQPVRGDNQRVLYIDDEEPLVFLVVRVLERNGYRCTGCTDPRNALELFRQDPQGFDLVITDMNMPGMNGLDVAREVLSVRDDIPVVITSGYVRAADVAATRTLGVRDLILKPDTISELAAVVGRYLRQ